MNWAWEQQLPPNGKIVLMALADIADDTGDCWPKVSTIAHKCCISERTVQRVFKEFEGTGLIMVTPRFTAEGRQTSNGYRLKMEAKPATPPPSSLASPLPSPCLAKKALTPPGGKVEKANRASQSTSINQIPATSTSSKTLDKPFELPKQLSKTERASVLLMIKQIRAEDIQTLLDEFSGVLASGTTIRTTPLQWFGGLIRCYKLGHFSPSAGVAITQSRKNRERWQQEQHKKATFSSNAKSPNRQIARYAIEKAKRILQKRAEIYQPVALPRKTLLSKCKINLVQQVRHCPPLDLAQSSCSSRALVKQLFQLSNFDVLGLYHDNDLPRNCGPPCGVFG